MIEVGRICVKTAGRDSNRYCVVLEKIDDNYVIIDGEVRRRKVNVKHLEPSKKKVDVKKDTSKDKCIELIKSSGFEIRTPKKRIIKKAKSKAEPKKKTAKKE
jgi:large subunit ribosomal protein L14e